MRISLVFGKRDQKKYHDLIDWLDTIDEGWRNEAIKEALSDYLKQKQLNSNVSNIHNFSFEKENVLPETAKYIVNSQKPPIIEEDDYMELKVEKNDSPPKSEESISSIDNFLGDF
jgi:hypothetical protein